MKSFFSPLKAQLIVIVCICFVWFFYNGHGQIQELISSHFPIMLTMLFGSFVAGSTSLGGGAVAFPVFTKLLSIPSDTALVFSLAIQSIGMTAAALMLVLTKTPIAKKVVIASILPGAMGIYFGLFYFGQFVPDGQVKFLFSFFSLFVAIVLIFDRFTHQRKFRSPSDFKDSRDIALPTIIIGGFIGGVVSGLIGTGIDFVLFSFMIIFSKAGLKRAVATSVCIMAINAIIGFSMIKLFSNHFTGEVVNYWQAAIPMVVIGGPLGALACKYFHRDIIFYFLMLLICLDVFSTTWIFGKQYHLLVFIAILILSRLAWVFINKRHKV